MPGTPSSKRFTFVCGPDDFLVGRIAHERFGEIAAGKDEFSREVISGMAGNIGEVETAVNRFRDAVQTLGLFGGQRAIWLKDISFLADNVTGRAEGTLKAVADLQEILAAVDPSEVLVLLSASPVDRRRSFPKWCEANGDFILAGESGRGGSGIDWAALAREECAQWQVSIGSGALELLVAKTGGNARLVVNELQKLATYLDEPGGTISERQVETLVPNVGEGDFFEAAEAFFAGDVSWTLDAIRRHFFAGHDARPLLSSLQNRNRLLIQLSALARSGQVSVGARGVDKDGLARAGQIHAPAYGDAAGEKGNFNVFTQNAWYLGKLAGNRPPPPLRKLIDQQLEFARAFEELIERPSEAEEVVRALAIRCLA